MTKFLKWDVWLKYVLNSRIHIRKQPRKKGLRSNNRGSMGLICERDDQINKKILKEVWDQYVKEMTRINKKILKEEKGKRS